MIKSLRVHGKHKLCLDTLGRIEMDDKKVSIKDIPYVRFTFEGLCLTNVDDYMNYMAECMEKFKYSVFIADVKFGEHTKEYTVQLLKQLYERFNMVNGEDVDGINLAVLLHIPFTKDDIDALENNHEQLISEKVKAVDYIVNECGYMVHRWIIDDIDQEITNGFILNLITDVIKHTCACGPEYVGVCGSPLLMACGRAGRVGCCLPASVVRSLQVEKEGELEVALVTEGHEGTEGTCGCTQYLDVYSDILVTKQAKTGNGGKGGKKKKESTGESTPKAPKFKRVGPPQIW